MTSNLTESLDEVIIEELEFLRDVSPGCDVAGLGCYLNIQYEVQLRDTNLRDLADT